MKKFVAILAAALCVAALAVPAIAAPGKPNYGEVPLYKGGITVDGKIDEAYSKLGLKVEIAGDYSEKYASEGTGNAYFLHDGTYLYAIVAMKNGDPFVAPTAKIDASTNSWTENGCEFYVDWKGDGKTSTRWFCWVDGQQVREGTHNVDLKAYKTTMDTAKQTYVLELQIPLSDGAKTGSTMGWYIMCNSHKDPAKLGQDHIAVPTNMNHVTGASKPAEWGNITLGSTEKKLPAATTAATKPATGTGSSAATFDAAIVMAVVAAAAGAGVVVSKKKH